jgi:hypothetical protein
MNDIIDQMLSVLNRAIEKDRAAITALLAHRVPCNRDLADDETIQVMSAKHGQDPFDTVGMLGILSGIAGCHEDGMAKIAALFDVCCPIHGVVSGKIGEKCHHCSNVLIRGRIVKFVRDRDK